MERTELWDIKGSEGYIYAAFIIDQMKVSQEAGSQDTFGFERGLMPFYLEVCPPKAAFSGFQTQP